MLGTQERVRELEHNMGQGQDALSKTNEALHAETARSAAVLHTSLPADPHVAFCHACMRQMHVLSTVQVSSDYRSASVEHAPVAITFATSDRITGTTAASACCPYFAA